MKKLILLLILISFSCKSRQVAIEKTKEDLSVNSESKTASKESDNTITETKTESSKTDISEVLEIEETFIPFDPSKPILITDSEGNTKTVNNGSYSIKKKKTKANVIEKDNTSVIEEKAVKKDIESNSTVKLSQEKDSKAKNTISKPDYSFVWWLIPWLIIIILLIIYRNKIKTYFSNLL